MRQIHSARRQYTLVVSFHTPLKFRIRQIQLRAASVTRVAQFCGRANERCAKKIKRVLRAPRRPARVPLKRGTSVGRFDYRRGYNALASA